MTKEGFDQVQFKAAQHQQWDTAAAGWRKWWSVIEASVQPLSDRLLELGAVEPGSRVLDVATGTGEPAVTAARRVGSTGHVVATDISLNMITIARERAAELCLQNIEFHVADAEALEFPESSFDAVLCRLGLMFLPDLPAALQRMRGLLAPGGRLAAAVPAEPPKYSFFTVAIRTVQEKLAPPLPPPGAPGLFSLSNEKLLEETFARSGFRAIHLERQRLVMVLDSPENYTQFIQEVAAPISAMVAREPAERQEEVWTAVTEAAREYAAPDETVRLPMEYILISGQR